MKKRRRSFDHKLTEALLNPGKDLKKVLEEEFRMRYIMSALNIPDEERIKELKIGI